MTLTIFTIADLCNRSHPPFVERTGPKVDLFRDGTGTISPPTSADRTTVRH